MAIIGGECGMLPEALEERPHDTTNPVMAVASATSVANKPARPAVEDANARIREHRTMCPDP
jgi:hypothetical protein